MAKKFWFGLTVVVVAAACGLAGFLWHNRSLSAGAVETPPVLELPPEPAEASTEQVHQFCGACHAYPPAETFPKEAWRKELRQAYDFFRDSKLHLEFPSLESVALYYERRAPDKLPELEKTAPSTPPLRFERKGFRPPDESIQPGVANVNLVHLFDKKKLDVLVCDVHRNQVLVLRPYEPSPSWQVLGSVRAPAHAEVVDLDGDGILDVVVASLGSFTPTDERTGGVVWLRGRSDGTFSAIPLLEGVGRTADVQAADFNGDGKLDLIAGVFGYRSVGEIIYLENQTSDWSQPKFVPHVLDDRHGTIHVPVCDLNQDGKPDFVALISQEHESVVAFLNEGHGRFRKETVYTGPHPAFGSSGLQLIDMNGDGKLDVLLTNGDVLDPPYLLKPYHGIGWLENRGTFPFVYHPLTQMYGVARAVAADLRARGKLDIVAVSALPTEAFPDCAKRQIDSVVLLEQAAPGKFVKHSLETVTCDHFTCAVGDLFGDGRVHFVTGNFFMTNRQPGADEITIWKNLGPAASKR